MRVPSFVPWFVYILAGFAAGSLFVSATPQALAQGVVTSTFGGTIEGTSKQPYTATWTQKQVQTLANGASITRESTTKFARDSNGRTYAETHRTVSEGLDEQPREIVSYHIFDTVTRTTTMWSSNSKEATVTHRPESMVVPAQSVEAKPEAPKVQLETQVHRLNPDVQREDLGTKDIAGVNAKGTRVTRVIPAWRDGNDQPITTIQETWRSTEYGVVLMSVTEDPRYGTTTHQVTEFTPGEPDAGLFRIPEGYSVREFSGRAMANQ